MRSLSSLIAPLTLKDGGTMHASSTRARKTERRRVTALATGLTLLAASATIAATPVGAAMRFPSGGVRAALPAATAGVIDPGTVCTSAGTGSLACDLYAAAGVVTLPGSATSLPVWSFTDTAGGQVAGAGPTLVVTAGDHVQITVHNDLPAEAGSVSLSVPQLDGFREDTVGAERGTTRVYTFTAPASRPGTYLYQAGPTANGARQAAMGMVGALLVRPAGGPATAYGSPGSAFDDEAVLVLTEIDPGLAAAPLTYDLRQWAPRWRLLNGRVHPAAPHIATAPGNRMLLRYVNGGLSEHALGLLGARQTEVARSGRELSYPADVASETVAPGDTLDTIVTVPAGGTLFPVYETANRLDNAGAVGSGTGSQPVTFGGMLTMLDTGPASGDDVLGPVASVTANPPRVGPGANVSFTATINDSATGGSNVQSAEWALDTLAGPWNPLAVTTPAVSITLSGTVLTASLSTGAHTIYVRGADAAGLTGDAGLTSFVYDAAPPTTTGLTVTPNPSNRPTSITVAGTASDATTGGSLVQSVQARLDDPTSAPVTLSLATAGTTSTFSGALPLPAALAEGHHTVYVRATDSLGNEGVDGSVGLDIDLTGPTAATSTSPGATNGVQGSDGDALSLEVSAVITDPVVDGVSSDVTQAEGFFRTVGANGTGFVLSKYTNGGVTRWIGYLPLSELVGKADGTYSVYAHGRDAAGNWGPINTGTFALDRTRPTLSTLVVAPTPTNGATTATVSATATDSGPQTTAITYAEWYEGPDPGLGRATPLQVAAAGAGFAVGGTIDVTTLTRGTHTLRARVRDAAGNWSTVVTTSLVVTLPNSIFSDGFETAASNPSPPWSSTTGGSNVTSTTSSPLVGARSLATAVSGTGTRYVTDARPVAEPSYHATFLFNPRSLRTSTAATPASVTIFQGLNAANQVAFQLHYRKNATSTPQVRLLVTRVGGTTATAWQNMPGATTTHTVRVDWASGTAAVSSLTVDALAPVATPLLNTSNRLVDSVRLGPSGGLATSSLGTPYFDSFVSTRYTLP